jgi:hypothetical protein
MDRHYTFFRTGCSRLFLVNSVFCRLSLKV